MADSRIFVAVIVALILKDEVLSCSLQSHKHGTSLCSSSASDSSVSDSTLTHHASGLKEHKIPTPCDSSSSSGSSSCSPNVLPTLPNGSSISSSQSNLIPTSILSGPPLTLPSTPFAPSSYNLDFLNSLTKLLTSLTTGIPSKVPQLSSTNQSSLSNLPTLNSGSAPVPSLKPHNSLSLPCSTSLSGSISSPSSSLPSLPCGSLPDSSAPGQISPLPTTIPKLLPTSKVKLDHTNVLQTFPSILSTSTGLSSLKSTPLQSYSPSTPTLNKNSEFTDSSSSKLTHSSPCSPLTSTLNKNSPFTSSFDSKLTTTRPCSLFTTLDKNPVLSASKSPTIPHHSDICSTSTGSNSCVSNTLADLPYSSSSSSKNTTPGAFLTSVPESKSGVISTTTSGLTPGEVSTHMSKEFSRLQLISTPSSVSIAIPASTSVPSTLSGHNQAILNHLLKIILSPKTSASLPNTLTSPLLPQSIPSTSKPNATSITSPIKKSPVTSSVCSTSLNPSLCLLSGSVLPLKSSLNPILPPSNPLLTPTFNSGIPSGYNPAYMKLLIKQLLSTLTSLPSPLSSSLSSPQALLNNIPMISPTPNLTPTTAQFDNKVDLTNSLNNIVKTPTLPCSSSSSSHSSSLLNIFSESSQIPNLITPSKSSVNLLPDLISKLPNFKPPDLTLTSSGVIPDSVTPSSNLNSFYQKLIENLVTKTTSEPTTTSFPCSQPPLSGLSLCRLKHLQTHAPRSHTRCSLFPHSKLNTGCKHLPLV